MIKINSLYDTDTCTFTHLVKDTKTRECIVIDPVLGFDICTARLSDAPFTPLVNQIREEELQLQWILETHAHADHLTSAQQLKKLCGGKIATGQGITTVQKVFKEKYGLGADFSTEGTQFDLLLTDNETLPLGDYEIEVLATPGHTPDSVSYKIAENIFIGDTLFHPTTGTARCDFPGGDAEQLFQSIQKLLSYDDSYRLYLCHDYPPEERQATAFVTVQEMKDNIHLKNCQNNVTDYVQVRNLRDRQLSLPKLIIPSIQVNICAGIDQESNSPLYLKWPVDTF